MANMTCHLYVRKSEKPAEEKNIYINIYIHIFSYGSNNIQLVCVPNVVVRNAHARRLLRTPYISYTQSGMRE